MKHFKILAILLFSSVLSFYSCNDTTKAPKQDTSKPTEVIDFSTPPKATPPTATAEPAQNALGVWHYTCRIGCPGGAGSAAKCDTCGNILVHNTTYHGNANSTSAAPFSNAPATPAQPATPEPAQNSAGVWHYTCAKGCVGGSGSSGACTTCGGALAHNSAYH